MTKAPALLPEGLRDRLPAQAEAASRVYDVDTREILIELGRRRMVGGQEDMIIDVAPDLIEARFAAARRISRNAGRQ